MRRAAPSPASGKTARKSASSRATCSSWFAVGPRMRDVGDVEDALVGAAGEPDAEQLAHARVGAVAAGDVGGAQRRLGAAGVAHAQRHARRPRARSRRSSVARSTSTPMRASAAASRRSCSSCGRMTHVRVRRQPAPDVVEHDAPGVAPARPQVDGRERQAARDDLGGDPELAVELERARVDDQRARRRPRRSALSMMRTATPRRASHSASTSPVGPAPTTATSVRSPTMPRP